MRLCRCVHLRTFLQMISHTIKWGKPVGVHPCQPPCLSLSRSSHLEDVTFFHEAGCSDCTVVTLPNIRQPLYVWDNLFIFLERVNNWEASPARARGNWSSSILIQGMTEYLKPPETCSLLKPERRERHLLVSPGPLLGFFVVAFDTFSCSNCGGGFQSGFTSCTALLGF